MSRIGKLPVQIPQGVKVGTADSIITVEGSKGKLTQGYKPEVSIEVKDGTVVLDVTVDSKKANAFHGLYRQLINNMVTGVSSGFTRSLLVNGVGYRVEVKGDILLLNLGYSTQIEYHISKDLTITCEGTNKITVVGIDKQKVGQACAEIRSLRPPEPYKGKGIKYEEETLRRKIGKSGIK
ncbi:MAG: 50S ribosomal protein L6 [Spirochaetia bacterium]|jgi:large subunit ribosomal protein L6|nr:50S ribosomal protein L6 [Spirochaetia bacterium]